MRPLDASDILTLWERGARRHALDRSVLLCARARPDWPPESIADRPLGDITAALLQLRAQSFGERIDSHVACSHCGARLALVLDTQDLLSSGPDSDVDPDADPDPDADAAADADAPCGIVVAGRRLRAPALRDLAAVAHEVDAGRAARALLARCTLHDSDELAGVTGASDAPIPSDILHACELALEALDPNADLALAVNCVVCGGASGVQLDAGILLWDEIDARARTLLAEVHALASAYGWSEGAILALDPARRASYLALVDA